MENSDTNLFAYMAPKCNFSMRKLCSMKEKEEGHYLLTYN